MLSFYIFVFLTILYIEKTSYCPTVDLFVSLSFYHPLGIKKLDLTNDNFCSIYAILYIFYLLFKYPSICF